MHYPKAGNDDSAERLCEVLLQHRDNRGFQMDAQTAPSRRPRTIFFTPDTAEEAQIADDCWVLPKEVGGACKQQGPRIAWPCGIPERQNLTRVPFQPEGVQPEAVEPIKPQDPSPQAPSLPSLPPPDADAAKAIESVLKAVRNVSPPLPNNSYTASKERYSSPPRQPGIMSRSATPPSQSALLKQELLALGPRPLASLSADRALESTSVGNQVDTSPLNSSTPLLRPEMGMYRAPSPLPDPAKNVMMQGPPPNWEAPVERKMYDDNAGANRRCCGP